jgi:hypothetical protein
MKGISTRDRKRIIRVDHTGVTSGAIRIAGMRTRGRYPVTCPAQDITHIGPDRIIRCIPAGKLSVAVDIHAGCLVSIPKG